jgi:hypothetical protein
MGKMFSCIVQSILFDEDYSDRSSLLEKGIPRDVAESAKDPISATH